MEQHERRTEDQKRYRAHQRGKAGWGVQLRLCGKSQSPGLGVVDLVRSDQSCRRNRAHRHAGHQSEDRADAKGVAKRTTQTCSRCVAGMVERLVAPKLVWKAALTHQTKRDPRYRGTDRSRCNAAGSLRKCGNCKMRGEVVDDAGADNDDCSNDQDSPLGFGGIDQRPQRRGRQHACEPADGHDNANLAGRPALSLQEDTQKWPKAVSNIGHEEIERVQTPDRVGHSALSGVSLWGRETRRTRPPRSTRSRLHG